MVRLFTLVCSFLTFAVLPALTQNLAEQKCKLYDEEAQRTDDFHPYSLDALDQYESADGEFPHMAALGFLTKDSSVYEWDISWECGGVLISENYILTAAHCLKHIRKGLVKFAHLGSRSLAHDGSSELLQVQTTIPHPNYKEPYLYNDIGLLKLQRPVKFSKHIFPACLNTISNFTKVQAIGWGPSKIGDGDVSGILRKIPLQYYDHDKCQEEYQNANRKRLAEGIQNSTQFCAGGVESSESIPICRLLSGSPLQLKSQRQLLSIVGLASFGVGCDLGLEHRGVYIRVSAYVPWIESIVWSSDV